MVGSEWVDSGPISLCCSCEATLSSFVYAWLAISLCLVVKLHSLCFALLLPILAACPTPLKGRWMASLPPPETQI